MLVPACRRGDARCALAPCSTAFTTRPSSRRGGRTRGVTRARAAPLCDCPSLLSGGSPKICFFITAGARIRWCRWMWARCSSGGVRGRRTVGCHCRRSGGPCWVVLCLATTAGAAVRGRRSSDRSHSRMYKPIRAASRSNCTRTQRSHRRRSY